VEESAVSPNEGSLEPRFVVEEGGAASVGRALIEAWNAHDVDRITAIHAADYSGVDVGDARLVQGRDGLGRAVTNYLKAFPDLHLAVDELVADGEQVVLLWSARGTHRGALMGIPPTRRNVDVRGVWVLALREDQIHRSTSVWDVAGMLRGIGLLPNL
jgi:steroid delta-isomerase-like uncharacterized protein